MDRGIGRGGFSTGSGFTAQYYWSAVTDESNGGERTQRRWCNCGLAIARSAQAHPTPGE